MESGWNMGSRKKWIAGAAAAYLLLLVILMLSERTAPNAGIRSFGDALWYSLVTLTTVGYGDLYPVTPAGRVIGLLFLCGSLGLLAAVATAVFSLLRSRTGPWLRLLRLRGKTVYLFSEENEASLALGRRLAGQDPDTHVVFCTSARNGVPAPEPTVHRWEAELPVCLRWTAGRLQTRGIFLMGEDAERNRALAAEIGETGCPVYCMTDEAGAPPGVRAFNPVQCVARQYWRQYPPEKKERVVLLAGDGSLAEYLLEQAIQVNARVPFARAEYHLFGAWEEYRLRHYALNDALFRANEPEQDRFLFYDASWAADPDLLQRADRIIFCHDDPARNFSDAGSLVRLFPFRGRVYAYGGKMPDGVCAFGGAEEVFTPETVTRAEQDRAAMALHALYCRENGQHQAWEDLTAFRRESNRAAADHLQTKLALLLPEKEHPALTPENARAALERFAQAPPAEREKYRRCEHERWMRFHLIHNWRCAAEKSEELRTHPSLRPYEQLPEEERVKDDYAWQNLAIPEKGADME